MFFVLSRNKTKNIYLYFFTELKTYNLSYYMFTYNLASIDIATAAMNMPFWIASEPIYRNLEFRPSVVSVVRICFSILVHASIFTMRLIVFNRCIKVVKPSLYKRVFPSKKAVRLFCALVWLFSIFLATPYLSGWARVSYHTKFAI